MTKTKLTQAVHLEFGAKPDRRLFRNNVGRLKTKEGTYVTYGLCVGSSDLIGFQSVVVTKAMLGRRVALFVAIECKEGRDTVRKEQTEFLNTVAQAGGLCGVATSIEDAERIFI